MRNATGTRPGQAAAPHPAAPHPAAPHPAAPHPAAPRPAGPAPAVLSMLASARRGLAEAAGEPAAGARYVTAHLAALRAAAAVEAARGGARGRRRKPRSVWELLPQVEPALSEWAAYFAAGAGKRAAAEAGLPRAASAREADDLLRDAETFLSLAETALGAEVQSPLPLRPAG
jgi:hypothetical protein